jgi:Fe-S-cluster containining protein
VTHADVTQPDETQCKRDLFCIIKLTSLERRHSAIIAQVDDLTLTDSIRLAMQRTDAMDAVRAIYARLQIEVDRRKPLCVASGKCCNFQAYGHRLYVTTLELATFMTDAGATLPTELIAPIAITDACPLQQARLCGVHAIRPFGCRIFFCDPTATDWQQTQYELFHAELKQLHERFAIPYQYVEWRFALATLGIAKLESEISNVSNLQSRLMVAEATKPRI